jgi:hypothetical protein
MVSIAVKKTRTKQVKVQSALGEEGRESDKEPAFESLIGREVLEKGDDLDEDLLVSNIKRNG